MSQNLVVNLIDTQEMVFFSGKYREEGRVLDKKEKYRYLIFQDPKNHTYKGQAQRSHDLIC